MAFAQIKLVLSQYKSSKISEKTRFGLLGKAKKGQYPFGNKPLIGISKDENDILYYDDEIHIVREIYELYVNCEYSSEFIAYLFREKYPQYS